MSCVRTWAGRRTAIREETPRTWRQVRHELSLASGVMQGETRDPVSGVTEDFHQTFDRIGQSRARALAEADRQSEQTGGPGQSEAQSRQQQSGRAEDITEASKRTGGMPGGTGGTVMPESGVPLQKFSEMAFQRGVLSASVLGGTGKMMLVSCLKRSVEYGEPDAKIEKGLFDAGGQMRNVPGRSPDKMLFLRGFADSAVGLVVDTLKDARQSVESMRDMAMGTGELDGERNAIARMYPFLDDSRERELYADYQTRLASCTDVRERAALQNGLVHIRALIDRKASMKEAFIGKLREISEKAEEALGEFEAPGFVEEVYQVLTERENDELPPSSDGENPPDDGEGGASPPEDSGSEDTPPRDSGSEDAPPRDGRSEDVPPEDSGSEDELPEGSSVPPEGDDRGAEAVPPDSGQAGGPDAVPPDSGKAGGPDAVPPDSGQAGGPDAVPPDSGKAGGSET